MLLFGIFPINLKFWATIHLNLSIDFVHTANSCILWVKFKSDVQMESYIHGLTFYLHGQLTYNSQLNTNRPSTAFLLIKGIHIRINWTKMNSKLD